MRAAHEHSPWHRTRERFRKGGGLGDWSACNDTRQQQLEEVRKGAVEHGACTEADKGPERLPLRLPIRCSTHHGALGHAQEPQGMQGKRQQTHPYEPEPLRLHPRRHRSSRATPVDSPSR